MGKITGYAHLALTCKDMVKSLDFYTRVLGFRKVFDIPCPDTGKPWIEYLHLGGTQFLELFYGGDVDNPFADEKRGFNHICFQVDDIHAVVEHVKKCGVVMDQEIKQGADYNYQAWIVDPDGARIELMQIDPKSPQAKAMNG